MIFAGLINIIFGLVYLVTRPIALLPDVTLPVNFTNAITTANGYLSSLNSFVPVDVILTLLSISLALEFAYFTFKMIMWVIKRFPTQS